MISSKLSMNIKFETKFQPCRKCCCYRKIINLPYHYVRMVHFLLLHSLKVNFSVSKEEPLLRRATFTLLQLCPSHLIYQDIPTHFWGERVLPLGLQTPEDKQHHDCIPCIKGVAKWGLPTGIRTAYWGMTCKES
jgi:hypothetical protein